LSKSRLMRAPISRIWWIPIRLAQACVSKLQHASNQKSASDYGALFYLFAATALLLEHLFAATASLLEHLFV
jgi:hypothetical protein